MYKRGMAWQDSANGHCLAGVGVDALELVPHMLSERLPAHLGAHVASCQAPHDKGRSHAASDLLQAAPVQPFRE